MDRALSGATIPGQSGPRSNGNEEVLRIPQSSSITGSLLSDCLVSYPGHWMGVIPLCRGAVRVFNNPQQTGQRMVFNQINLIGPWQVLPLRVKLDLRVKTMKGHFRAWELVGWLVVFLWYISLCCLFNAKSIFMKIFLFQTIQLSISTQFKCEKHFYFKLFSLVKQFYC